MQTLSAEIKVTDRYGVNPIRWNIYIEAQMGNANLYNAFLQSGSWGKRYLVKNPIEASNIHDVLAVLVKKIKVLNP